MSEQTTETTTTNETLSTSAQEQQAPEKTIEEQFYGTKEETTESESQDQTASTNESSEASEEVDKVEGEKESGEQGKTEDSDDNVEGEDWTLELPEESFVTEEAMKEIEAFAKDNKLSKEAASKLLERENLAVADYINKQDAELEKELKGWRDSVINDPDMGGENLKTTVETARRVVEHFGTEEFISLLSETGYGDHPEVVRVLSRIGKLMSDDSLVTPQSKAQTKDKPLEEYFYGKTNN
jgi:hypothetical protein